jgi:hypothetical protein
MNRVFVLSNTKKPLMPCHPARASELLRKGKAAVFSDATLHHHFKISI